MTKVQFDGFGQSSADQGLVFPAEGQTPHAVHQLMVWFALGGSATVQQQAEAARRDVTNASTFTHYHTANAH